MPSTFFGLEIGKRALQASQLALDTVGHNTGNVNTPGYSRQVVAFDETDPYTIPDAYHSQPGELGTGVTISSVTRIRDLFTDKRVYAANSGQGSLTNLRDILGRVEDAYNEPGNIGIGQQMTALFNTFSQLSTDPQNEGIRSTVRNQAETLVSSFHSVSTALSQINPEITAKIDLKIGDINAIATQIAALNKQIGISVAVGDHPNDLMDKRGQLIDQLSRLVDVQVTDAVNATTHLSTGQLNINVGGFAVVQGDTAGALPTTITTVNNQLGLVTASGDTIPIHSGELYGLVKSSVLVAGYQTDLDTLAYNLITSVNAQHAAGYALDGTTGNLFFGTPLAPPGTGAAAGISVSVGVETSLDKIAAAAAPMTPPFAPGNGDNARGIAQLSYQPTIGAFSLDGYYNSKVALVGADSKSFQTESDNQDRVLNQLKNQQLSVSGVNLDEELTNMLQYQRTYQAAARVLNMSDEFLDKIINGLGSGR